MIHLILLLFWLIKKANEPNKPEIKKIVELKLEKIQSKKATPKGKTRNDFKKGLLDRFLPKKTNWAKKLEEYIGAPKSEAKRWAENIEDSHFSLLIWNKIEKVLYFPMVFQFFLIEGNIKARISLNPDGTLKWNPSVDKIGNKYLEQYIYASLKKAFITPLQKNRWGKNKKLYTYDLNFNFYISYSPGEGSAMMRLPIDQESLNFYRQGFNYKKSPVQKRLPFFMGEGFMINYVKIYERLSGAERRKLEKMKKKLEDFHFENKQF